MVKRTSIAKEFAKKKIPHIYYKTQFEIWKARTEPWNKIYFQKKAKETMQQLVLNGIYVKQNNPHFGPFIDFVQGHIFR